MEAQPNAIDDRLRIRAGYLSLVLGSLIFAGKLGAWAFTGSTAVYSDAMESVVNVAAAGLLVYSLIIAARPADRGHPYGHGKVEFFSAGVEGALIAVAAVLILVQAARAILAGPQIRHLNEGVAIVSLLAVANALLGLYLIRVGKRTGSIAIEADGRHLMTDVVTSVGVAAGLGAVWATGWTLLDPLVAIAVALNILRTGWFLMRRAVGGLMDEADVASLERMVTAIEAEREPWCIDVHSLRSMRSGAAQHVDLHVVVPRYYDAEQLHEIDTRTNERILGALGIAGDVIVHFDPCRPRHCPSCAMVDCPVRAVSFQERRALSVDGATRGDEVLDTGAPLGREPA